MYRHIRIFAVLAALAPGSFAQTLFSFPALTEAASVVSARGAYRITLDVPGDPVLYCQKDDGLFEKTCSHIGSGVTAGYSGYKPSASSDFHDLRTVQITHGAAWDAEPAWSIPWGCVDGVFIINTDLRKLFVGPTEVICDASRGGLLGALCSSFEDGDCGTFEGHYVGTVIHLDQALAHRGFLDI